APSMRTKSRRETREASCASKKSVRCCGFSLSQRACCTVCMSLRKSSVRPCNIKTSLKGFVFLWLLTYPHHVFCCGRFWFLPDGFIIRLLDYPPYHGQEINSRLLISGSCPRMTPELMMQTPSQITCQCGKREARFRFSPCFTLSRSCLAAVDIA